MTIQLPEDNTKSRLQRASKSEGDDFVSAESRIEAFWERFPEGSILPEVEEKTIDDFQNPPYRVFTVRAYIRKNAQSERPDSVAHATRGEDDADALVAQFPQETAETAAISRAIRNLGILATKTAPAKIREPQTDEQIGTDVATARERAGLSQKELAAAMTDRGFKWAQATVSQIEKGERPLRLSEADHLAELIRFRT
jgi:ribosome-binding protein aMBF1 (putative translation factor)